MTTTAAAWRHRWERGDTRCTAPDDRDPHDICGCTTPTPLDERCCDHEAEDGLGPHCWACHPEGIFTRCLCGHPLEAVRAEQREEKP